MGIDFNFSYSQSALVNNIMYSPEPQQVVNQYDPVSFLLTCGQLPSNESQQLDIHDDLLFNPGTIYPTFCSFGSGMVYADAQLVDPVNGNYRLQPTSPAIDAGDINAPDLPTADFAGKNRTVCGTVDLGAYNHHPAPPIILTAGQGTISGGSTASFSVQLTGNCNTPAGPVTFLDGSTSLGTATLTSGGSATFSTSTLTVGTHTITATYPGDFNFDPSTSNNVTQVVTGYPTTTTLSAAPNPATALQAIMLASTVSSQFGTPTGTVGFYAGANLLATAALNSGGQAQTIVTTLGVGTYSLTAVYSASTKYASSTSPAVTEVVTGAVTATSLTAAPNPSSFGQAVSFTAAAAAPKSTSSPTGTVIFRDGSTNLGQSAVSASGVATFTTSALSVGTHVISAASSGSINDNSSTSATLTQIVTLAPIAATLTANPNPANQGQTVSIAVTVSSPGLTGPSGNITFNDLFQGITTTLATTSLVDGQAAFSISTLDVGTHVLTAVYAGSGNYAAGTAPAISEVIQPHDFSIALAPKTISSAAGTPLHIAITLTSLGSYVGNLNLTAANLPQYAAATFSPSTVSLTAG